MFFKRIETPVKKFGAAFLVSLFFFCLLNANTFNISSGAKRSSYYKVLSVADLDIDVEAEDFDDLAITFSAPEIRCRVLNCPSASRTKTNFIARHIDVLHTDLPPPA